MYHYVGEEIALYTLLILVPQEVFESWKWAFFDGAAKKLKLLFNVRIKLKVYIWLCYDELMSKDTFLIGATIDMALIL